MSDGNGAPDNSRPSPSESSDARVRLSSAVGTGDIFDLHGAIVRDYRAYIESFVTIADDAIRKVVQASFERGDLWPEPLLQLNPAFEEAGDLRELIQPDLLHADCEAIFTGYRLYRHQREAIQLGLAGKDFVVTSGTGSGKSLTYIGTIFNHLLRAGEPVPQGVTAVIVYPLNALVNSQEEELRRYAENYRKGAARISRFGSQSSPGRKTSTDARNSKPIHRTSC